MGLKHPKANAELVERARSRRRKRRRLISVACAAGLREMVAERSKMVDWFDRLPIDTLRAIHDLAKTQYGEQPWTPKKSK